MVVKCADCWCAFLNKECLLTHLEFCGAPLTIGGTLQQGHSEEEVDLKTLIAECKEAVQSAPSISGSDDGMKGLEKERNRVEDSSAEERIYNCGECSCSFIAIPQLLSHLETHSSEKMYQCPMCAESFSYFWSLNYHFVRSHFNEKPFSCLECGNVCCSIRVLDRCLKSNLHGKASCCTSCPRYWTCRDELEPAATSCDFCEEIFPSFSASRTHLETCSGLVRKLEDQHASYLRISKIRHETSLQPLRESHTGQKSGSFISCEKIVSPLYLADNTSIRNDETRYSCDLCERVFSQLTTKLRHMKTHTVKKRYSCDFCARKFFFSSQKVIHMRRHTGDKPYSCDFCEKRFTQSTQKVQHMRRHTGDKPYSCDFCGKRFTQSAQKVQHMRLHTGHKPYSCDFCEKIFTQSAQKVQHMRLHTGDKPYSCDFCEKRFTQSTHKVQHMRMHTGEKPLATLVIFV